jgi:hypothetical protein
MAFQARPLSVE